EVFDEPVPLHDADAVLTGNRSTKSQGELEEPFGKFWRECELCFVVPGEQEHRVEVAVACVSPRTRRDAEPPSDLERLLDRFAEPVERHCNVLACLAAALSIHDQRQTV